MSHIYCTLQSLNTGRVLIIYYYIILIQITYFFIQLRYFDTLINICKPIFKFLKMPTVIERSAEP